MWPSRPLFHNFPLFNIVHNRQMFNINFYDDWIRTTVSLEMEATTLPTEPEPFP